MKTNVKNRLRILISSLVVGLFLISCSTDDDSNNTDNTQEIMEANSIATTGTWRVSSLIDDGQDETSDFNGYVFTFDSSGSLTASNGTTDLIGTWSIEDDSSSDDDDDDDIDFNIFFAVSEDDDFDDLVDDWDIVSINDTMISLVDVSGGDGGTDTLVFTKI